MGDSFWHKDDYGSVLQGGTPKIKVVMYLEPVEKDTGCLRIIPGSHHQSFKQALCPLDQQYDDLSVKLFGMDGRDFPSHAMETHPTDLIILEPTAYHGSFGGRAGRRNLQLLYFPFPTDDTELDVLRQIHRKTEHTLRAPESFLNSGSPRLTKMVSEHVRWEF